jgi:hypothetical protein
VFNSASLMSADSAADGLPGALLLPCVGEPVAGAAGLMIWPAKVSRSTTAAQSRGSVMVLVRRSTAAIAVKG